MFDLAIRNGMLVTADRVFGGHLYVRNGKIAAISDDGTLPAREELDAAGLYVLPGMLDCHAHINDPGFTWREDLPHASEAAAVGGVTTLIDMPLQNTPPLTSADAFANKLAVFEGRSLVDYALWGGLVTDNAAELAGMDAAGAVGFKAFIAAVLGGIGSIQGAMIGGLLLGFIEIMTVAFMPSLSGYRDAFAFVVLVLVLLVRPTGLFGQRSEEKI